MPTLYLLGNTDTNSEAVEAVVVRQALLYRQAILKLYQLDQVNITATLIAMFFMALVALITIVRTAQ